VSILTTRLLSLQDVDPDQLSSTALVAQAETWWEASLRAGNASRSAQAGAQALYYARLAMFRVGTQEPTDRADLLTVARVAGHAYAARQSRIDAAYYFDLAWRTAGPLGNVLTINDYATWLAQVDPWSLPGQTSSALQHEMRTVLERLLADHPESADAHRLAMLGAKRDGAWTDVVTLGSRALELLPEEQAWNAAVKIDLAFKVLGDVVDAYGRTTGDGPSPLTDAVVRTLVTTAEAGCAYPAMTRASIRAVELLIDIEQTAQASSVLATLGPTNPDEARQLTILRARLHALAEKHAEAVALFDTVDLDEWQDHLYYLICLFNCGRLDDARREWDLCSDKVNRAFPVTSHRGFNDQLTVYLLSISSELRRAVNDFSGVWGDLATIRVIAERAGPEARSAWPPETRVVALRVALAFEADGDSRLTLLGELQSAARSTTAGAVTAYVDAALKEAQGQVAAEHAHTEEVLGRLRAAATTLAKSKLLTWRVAQGESARSGNHPAELTPAFQARMALLIEDLPQARDLLRESPCEECAPENRDCVWQHDALRAQVQLRLARSSPGEGHEGRAFRLTNRILGECRQELEARLLHVESSRASGHLDEALAEVAECVAVAPGHIFSRLLTAECRVAEASRSSRESHSSKPSSAAAADTEAAPPALGQPGYQIHQLIGAVAEYTRAVRIHCELEKWLLDTGKSTSRHWSTPPDVSDLMPDQVFMEACRRGLHAASTASEELGRAGLLGDYQLKQDMTYLKKALRRRQQDPETFWLLKRLPIRRDEPKRLGRLFMVHRTRRLTRVIQRAFYLIPGVALMAGSLWVAPDGTPDALLTLLAGAGAVLAIAPFFVSLKMAGMEVQSKSEDEIRYGRSTLLASASTFQLGSRPLSALSDLPPPPRSTEDPQPPGPPPSAMPNTPDTNTASAGNVALQNAATESPTAEPTG
jgi:hypothetical protein